MALTLEMYTFSKKMNSTKQPLGSGTTVSAAFKDNTSVVSPTFIIKTFDTSWNYIKWGSRYYFVDDIVIISNDHAEYVCRTDVLATFKSVIGSSSQYVLRAASAYNPYAMDMKYPAQAASTLSNVSLSGLAVDSTGLYVLGVIGAGSTNTITYYTMGATNFAQLMIALFDTSYLNAQDISVELQKELVNPFQYIVSCYWYPFTATQMAGDMAQIKFGWWDSGVYGGKLTESQRVISLEQTFELPRHPQAGTRGIYLNDSPYTRYMLNCYSFGSIPIDPAPFVANNAGAIEIDVDIFTGVAQMYVATQSSRLFTEISQFGVPIQINQNTANVIGGAVSMAGGLVGLAYGNYVGAAQGVLSAIESAFPQVQSKGANGSKVAFMQTPNIVASFRQLVEEDNVQIGRPLCQQKTISTLSGYILCEDADLDSAGTSSEKTEIVTFMNSGFYYE